MDDSKVTQSNGSKRLKRVLFAVLLFLVLCCSLVVGMLHSNALQKAVYHQFVEEELAQMNLSWEFQGWSYEFPNTFRFPATTIAFKDTSVVRLGAVSIEGITWSGGLLIDQFLLEEIKALQAIDDPIYSRLTQQFSSEDSLQEPLTLEAPFSIRIGQWEIGPVSGQLLDQTSLGVSLQGSQLQVSKGLEQAKLQAQAYMNTDSLHLHLDSLQVGPTGHANALFGFTLAQVANATGSVAYTDSISSIQLQLLVEHQPELAAVDLREYHDFLSNARILTNVEWDHESFRAELQSKQDLLKVQGQAQGQLSLAQPAQFQLDVKTREALFETDLLRPYNELYTRFKPRKIRIQGESDLAEDHRIDLAIQEGSSYLNIQDISLDQPISATAYFEHLNAGPLEEASMQLTLQPNLQSVLDSMPVTVFAVLPSATLSGQEVKGMTAKLWHHGNAQSDSLWVNSLDPQFDLEGKAAHNQGAIDLDIQLNHLALELLDPLDTGQVLQAHLTANLDQHWDGYLALNDVMLQRPDNVVFLREARLDQSTGEKQHQLSITSDVLNASLIGDWKYEQLGSSFIQMFEDVKGQQASEWTPATFSYDLKAGDIAWITDLLHLDAYLSPESYIYGQYNGAKQRWSIVSDVPEFIIEGVVFKGLNLSAIHSSSLHRTRAVAKEVSYANIYLDTFYVHSEGTALKRDVHAVGEVRDSISWATELRGELAPGGFLIRSHEFNVGESLFELDHPAQVRWSGDALSADSLGWAGLDGAIWIDGSLIDKESPKLRMHLRSLDARIVNYMLREPTAQLAGKTSADITLQNSLTKPVVIGFVNVQNLGLNDFEYGNLTANVRYNPAKDIIARGQLRNATSSAFTFQAHYNPFNTEVDLRMSMDAFDVSPFNPMLGGILDELEGQLQGGIELYGPLDNYKLDGSVQYQKGHFTVPVIGAELATSRAAELHISESLITLDSTSFYAPKDSTTAWAWGNITHDRFDDILFDLRLHADSLRAVDMDRSIDGYFYGTAVAMGDMSLEGPLEQLHLDLAIETKDGTNFKIPLDNPTAVETPSFIQFVVIDRQVDLDRETLELEYFTSDIAIAATQEAQVELILDEVLGDIIKARGEGNLRLRLLEDESMELFGLYTVTSGSYLFTLQNIINKPFTLVPGGTILWSGDLYEAEVNLQAKYALSTDLEGLVSSPSYGNENVDVDLIIELTGDLMSPDIAFHVELPNSPASYVDELQRHFLTEDAMNYQAFSLLMLGEFFKEDLTVQENVQLGASIENTTSELLVSEFGSWLAAGIGSYVELELDYTNGTNPYNNIGGSGDNLNLGVSKDFLDGRLSINSSLDIPIAQEGASTLLLGDTEVTYSITKDGKIKLRAFNRSNRNDPLLQNTGPYTQGVGILFHKEFDRMDRKEKQNTKD